MVETVHSNNTQAFLAAVLNPGDTTLVLQSGQGAQFPAISFGITQFWITIEDRDSGKREIALCTNRVSDSLTIVRAQQGTTALLFDAGTSVSNRVTAEFLDSFDARLAEAADDSGAAAVAAATALSVANTANTTANTAKATADATAANLGAIDTKATNALALSATAVTTANAAQTAANSAVASVVTATDAANNAAAAAAAATSAASAATSAASTATSTAVAAQTSADAAQATASAAQTTANNNATAITTKANLTDPRFTDPRAIANGNYQDFTVTGGLATLLGSAISTRLQALSAAAKTTLFRALGVEGTTPVDAIAVFNAAGNLIAGSSAASTIATAVNYWLFSTGLKLSTPEGLGSASDYKTIPITAGSLPIDGGTFWNGIATATVASVNIPSVTGLNSWPRYLELYANGVTTTFTVTGGVFDAELPSTIFPLVVPNGERRVLVLTNVSGNDRAMLLTGSTAAASAVPESIELEIFGPTTACTVGDGKVTFYIPPAMAGMNITGVWLRTNTAGVTGTMDVQLANVTLGVDVLSTKMSMDSGENIAGTGVATDATPPVINLANDALLAHDQMRIDFDTIHTTAALGATFYMEASFP